MRMERKNAEKLYMPYIEAHNTLNVCNIDLCIVCKMSAKPYMKLYMASAKLYIRRVKVMIKAAKDHVLIV